LVYAYCFFQDHEETSMEGVQICGVNNNSSPSHREDNKHPLKFGESVVNINVLNFHILRQWHCLIYTVWLEYFQNDHVSSLKLNLPVNCCCHYSYISWRDRGTVDRVWIGNQIYELITASRDYAVTVLCIWQAQYNALGLPSLLHSILAIVRFLLGLYLCNYFVESAWRMRCLTKITQFQNWNLPYIQKLKKFLQKL
jgi:hypothetical protein